MTALPVISGADCVRALRRVGYIEVRRRGSHVRLACDDRPFVTVPLHRTLDRGTLRSILRTCEIPVDEFIALLG
jgi:predicted RNA binding protein YcfA (HicA-like mRNA interferase family)